MKKLVLLMPILLFSKEIVISDLNVTAKKSNGINKSSKYLDKSTLDSDTISSLPHAGNGGITSVLRANPNVNFNRTGITSKNLGEINPEDISINGAKPWQTSFMVDGVNFNNDLNPGGESYANTLNEVRNKLMPDLSSFPQGVSLDADLMSEINLFESGVSSRYGRFLGGVVDAKTRFPRDGFHGVVSTSHTGSSWTKYKVSKDDEDFENGVSNADELNQPNFRKDSYRLGLEGYITDNIGLIFDYKQTRSKILQRDFKYAVIGGVRQKVYLGPEWERRINHRLFLKGIYFANDFLTVVPTITYSPSDATLYSIKDVDSRKKLKTGGLISSIDFNYENDSFKFDQTFSFTNLETSRKVDRYNWIQTPNGYIGGMGDFEGKQKTFTYKNAFESDEFDVGKSTHKFGAGLEFSHKKGLYRIPKEFFTATFIAVARNGCLPGDEFCYPDEKRFNRMLQVYRKGKASKSINEFALWLEDDINIANFNLRPGIRIDNDNYMDKTTVAPRFVGKLNLNENTWFSLGLNRYYGRNSFDHALKDAKNSLMQRYMRGKSNEEFKLNKSWLDKKSAIFRTLDIPYQDEYSFGFRQKIDNLEFMFKYVKSDYKKEIVSKKAKDYDPDEYSNPTYFTNDGRTRNWTYTLSLKNIEPFYFYDTTHNFELSYSRARTKSDNNGYLDIFDENSLKEVYFNGKKILYGDLPKSSSFKTPWRGTLTTISNYKNITLSNYFSIIGKRDIIVKKFGRINRLDVYETKKLKRSLNWDARVSFNFNLAKKSQAFVNLDILNVLDKRVLADYKSDYFGDKYTYEPGRQFILEAGYRW